MYRDVSDVFNGGQWSKEGQKRHFMRYPGQGELKAYDEACTWIYSSGLTAAQHLRDIWVKQRGYYNPIYVTEPLGDAMHAIQDSFSEAHVKRVEQGDTWVIMGINVYDQTNKKASGTYPGHQELDRRWKDTPLGHEAMLAGRELINIVVYTSLRRDDHTVWTTWQSLWNTYSGVFLSCGLK